MSIFSFIDQDQLDNLDEDPRIAFMELANIVTRELQEKTKNLDESERSEWRHLEDLRFSCMNVLLASAKNLEVEPFASMEMPAYDSDSSSKWQAFKFDLDHYIAQIVLENRTRNRLNSVAISPKTKDQIRSYVHRLRECIENGNLDEKKRDNLLSKLDALERELEKQRASMIAIAAIAYNILAVPGTLWASADIANKLVTNVLTTVAEAKAEEDATKQLIKPEPMKALSAPRNPKPIPDWGRPSNATYNGNLDDDIPF